jgi:hypothetical protein
MTAIRLRRWGRKILLNALKLENPSDVVSRITVVEDEQLAKAIVFTVPNAIRSGWSNARRTT